MAVGGSIEEVTMAGRSFTVPADNEAQLKIGGKSNDSQANGNGTSRLIQTVTVAGLDGLLVEISHVDGDLIFLQELANSKEYFVFTATMNDEAVYQGQMQITGDLQGSSQSATAAVTLMGNGPMTLQ